MTEYVDTLVIVPDSAGGTLRIRRVLVNADSSFVVSRGSGTVTREHGDSTFAVRWREIRFPDFTGRMRWVDGQWVIAFDSAWSAWSVHVRYDTPRSIVGAVARALGVLPPMELTALTYRAVSRPPGPKPKPGR